MPQLKVKLIGSGKDGDPYRVNLPTYQLRHGNISEGYAIVHVPDEVLGKSDDDLRNDHTQETTEGPLHVSLDDKTVGEIHDHFDGRYQEHKGKFRIEEA